MNDKLANIKERYLKAREKSIIRNFYSKESNKGKSYRANYMDSFLMLLLIFLALVIFLIIKTNSLILPIYISLITVFLITKLARGFKEKKEKEKILKINEDLKSKRVVREISQFNSREFIEYIKSILEKYYQVEFFRGSDGIDLTAKINDKNYAVKVIKSSMEDKVIKKKLDDFYNYIHYLEYDEGIIVTNSFFLSDTKDNSPLILIDFLGIKEILKSINEYPSDEEINNYIIHRFDNRKKDVEKEIKSITFKKIIKLYGVFIIFYTISFFVRYTFYYRMMAVLAFIIATILGGIKITESLKGKTRFTLLK